MDTANSLRPNQHSARQPDVIVIGAGVTGCNAAWHLHQRGLRVQVLESQERPATQTTRAAAGFVCLWSGINNPTWHSTEWSMQRYGIDFYQQLAERCGSDIGFHACGIAYIQVTESGWADLQPRIVAAQQLGTKLEILDSVRAKQVLPLINYEATEGIVFDPDAVRVRAAAATPALAIELANAGIDFQYGSKVTGFDASNGRVRGVKSLQGTFPCSQIVIAAGAWSRSLLATLNVACPTEPVVQSRFVTPPLPGVDTSMPMLIFPDCHGFYIREEFGGLLIGGSDNRPLPQDRYVDAVNPPHTEEIITNQAYRVRDYIRKIENVMPVLRNAEVAEIATGLPAMTEDLCFVADKVPGCEGLYALAACQYAGVTHGPALGKMMAELIVDGKTTWDRTAFQLNRFST